MLDPSICNTGRLHKENLVNAGWGIDEIQAKAILELRLQRLPEWSGKRSKKSIDELMKLIASFKGIIGK